MKRNERKRGEPHWALQGRKEKHTTPSHGTTGEEDRKRPVGTSGIQRQSSTIGGIGFQPGPIHGVLGVPGRTRGQRHLVWLTRRRVDQRASVRAVVRQIGLLGTAICESDRRPDCAGAVMDTPTAPGPVKRWGGETQSAGRRRVSALDLRRR